MQDFIATIIKQFLNHRTFFLCWLVILITLSYLIFIPYFTHFEEPHYVAVSWYMWHLNDWIVLHDTSGIYINKPPLLFWLVNVTWHIFGLNSWIFRLLPTLATLGTLWLIQIIFRQLWPSYAPQSWIAAALFIGTWYNMHYVGLFLFEMPLIFFIALSLVGLIKLLHKKLMSGLIIFILANGLGLLTKGPVIFIYTLSPAFLAPFLLNFNRRIFSWLLLMFFGLLTSLLISGLWAGPVIYRLNQQHLISPIFNQLSTMKHLLGHRPWWFYFVKLPLLLIPWTLWPRLYRAIFHQLKMKNKDPYWLWLVFSSMIIFVLMSFFPAKSSRYLMPIGIYMALIFAYCLQNTLTTLSHSKKLNQSIYLQCFFMFLLVIANILGPLRLNLNAPAISQFEQCVYDNLGKKRKKRPIAYQYRYAGYWFHINQQMLPTGPMLRSKIAFTHWLRENRKGLLVLNETLSLSKTKKVCELQIGKTTEGKHNFLYLQAIKRREKN